MSKPDEHMDKLNSLLDEIYAELEAAGRDGHFDEPMANVCAGAVRYEITRLRSVVE